MQLVDLSRKAASGEIDTVIVGFCDMQGRLQGKRFTANHFLNEIVDNGTEGCEYLLAVDVEMNTVSGYEHASWDTGYGDFVMRPDLSTLRLLPWLRGTALCLADIVDHDGVGVAVSPRQVLQRQLNRLAERGLYARSATELEFCVFEETYEQAWDRGYTDLTPANRYNVDYSILGATKVEPLIHRIRNEMGGAGMVVESSKGECNLGQHEVNLRHELTLTTADNHVIFKNGVKEIASQEGCSITFMAKYNELEGNSCHVHMSLEDANGDNAFAADDAMFGSFVQGLIVTLRELTLFHAPHVNSYKRFQARLFAPTSVAWGDDNRTAAVRVIGHGASRRLELRLPGADVNPYISLAAMIAGGLFGVESGLKLEAPVEGNSDEADSQRVPSTISEAAELTAASKIARDAFGSGVVDHYLNAAKVELDSFNSSVTDWERVRSFERL